MSHTKTTDAEFARQARTFADAPALQAPELTTRIAEALDAHAAGRVLDVGCGPGILTPVLAGRARQVVGIDLTAEVVRLAHERHGQRPNVGFVRGLVEHLPFAPASFDAAVIRLALHHFEHADVVLADVRRLLRPGGRVVVVDILTVPDPETAALHNAIEILRDPSHVRFVTLATLRATVHGAGFAPVREESWTAERTFLEWARITNEPKRMGSLEIVMRRFARAGIGAGIDLREHAGELRFDYPFALIVADAV